MRIGLWGTFDLENYGDMLFPRVTRAELARRLPSTELRVYAPLGYAGLNRFDDGEPVASLGAWSPERAAELASELDLVVVGPGEIIHTRDHELAPHYGLSAEEMTGRAPSRFFIEGLGPELEREVPVLWHAVGIPHEPTAAEAERLRSAMAGRPYVSVRDEGSRERLRAAGVDRDVAVVPDPALLVPRLFGRPLLERRLAFLRTMGWYPAEGRVLVVQGNRDLLPAVERYAGALTRLLEEDPQLSLLLVETGPIHGDGELAEALAALLPPGRTRRLGAPAGLEDLVSVIACSEGFVGSSLHGNLTALAYGRLHVAVDVGGASKLAGFAELVGAPDCRVEDPGDLAEAVRRARAGGTGSAAVEEMQARLHAHFDYIAGLARSVPAHGSRPAPAASPKGEEAERDELATAYRALQRRVAAQQAAFADRVRELREALDEARGLVSERDEHIARLQDEVGRLDRLVRDRDDELRVVRSSPTFRLAKAIARVVRPFVRR